jgi:hypothetical protein
MESVDVVWLDAGANQHAKLLKRSTVPASRTGAELHPRRQDIATGSL